MRTVEFQGQKLSVQQAKEFIDELKTKVHALGRPPRPKYNGLGATELYMEISDLLNAMLTAMKEEPSADLMCKMATTQFGWSKNISEYSSENSQKSKSQHSWQVSLSTAFAKDSSNLHISCTTDEFDKNVDGETDTIDVPDVVFEVVQKAIELVLSNYGAKVVESHRSNYWISFSTNLKAPQVLIEAYKNYEPFKTPREKFENFHRFVEERLPEKWKDKTRWFDAAPDGSK